MKSLPLILSLLLTTAPCFAEANKQKINAIRKIYASTNAKIATTEKSPKAGRESNLSVDQYTTNVLNRSWEAVGNYKVIYRYYYYHDAPNDANKLIKISVQGQSAAYKYLEEYYYDQAQNLVFYYHSKGNEPGMLEKRVYFDKKRGIRIIDGKNARDEYTDGDKEILASIRKREKSLILKFSLK